MTTKLAICCGLTRLDPAAYEGWPGDCPGCDIDLARTTHELHARGVDHVAAFLNQFADHKYVKPAFTQVVKPLQPKDLLVLYNSGHGGQSIDESGDEEDGWDETLCWWSGEVLDDKINQYLRKIPAGVNCLMIVDSCNSQTMARGRRWAKGAVPYELGERAVAGLKCNLLLIAGCADGESSYGDGETGGILTRTLWDTLDRARKPMTYRRWFDRTAEKMPKYQRPYLTEYGRESFVDTEALT